MGSQGETKDDSSPATAINVASECETKDECSQPMDITSGSVLGKRGLESLSREDPDEDPTWDKDSLDGREYNPDADHGGYSDEESRKLARQHNRKVIESKGFFVPKCTLPYHNWRGICKIPDDLDQEFQDGVTPRQFLSDIAVECVNEFKHRNQDKELIFIEFLRANWNPGSINTFYITFIAKESKSPDAPNVEYQAKADWSVGNKTRPILCRPAPPNKRC